MDHLTSYDGTPLAVHSHGPDSAPVIVFVPGLGMSAESWGTVPEELSSRHRVVVYELRGHGRSGAAAGGDYSLTAHAKDLGEVLAAIVPAGEQAVLVGNSLGGGIIVACAHECGSERMAGVVFAGSGGSAVTVPGFPARRVPDRVEGWLRRGWLALLRAVARAGHWIRPVDVVSNWLVRRSAFSSSAPEELVDRVRQDFLSTRPRALSGTTLASVSHDGTRLAPELTAPTLVIHGTQDPEVSNHEVRQLLDALPQAELMSVEGAGHMLPLTDGDLVVEQVSRWVRHVGLGDHGVVA